MKKKCNECGQEIRDGGTKKLMNGANGYRLYDVCKKHVAPAPSQAASDVITRAEIKMTGHQSHRMGVKPQLVKKISEEARRLEHESGTLLEQAKISVELNPRTQ